MTTENLTQLRFKDCLNFCNGFLDDVRKASPEEIINAFFELALANVNYGCKPETDKETRQVLAVYQADCALRIAKIDVTEKVRKAEASKVDTYEDESFNTIQ